MPTKPTMLAAMKQTIRDEIVDAQRRVEKAKKVTKTAKATFRDAKDKFKAARKSGKKFKKELKLLKAELAGLDVKIPTLKKIEVAVPPAKKRGNVKPSSKLVADLPASFPKPAPDKVAVTKKQAELPSNSLGSPAVLKRS